MKKGSVTVYMTWMLAVLLSLFVTVIEGARQSDQHTGRNRCGSGSVFCVCRVQPGTF